jgi:hypothetical protein
MMNDEVWHLVIVHHSSFIVPVPPYLWTGMHGPGGRATLAFGVPWCVVRRDPVSLEGVR